MPFLRVLPLLPIWASIYGVVNLAAQGVAAKVFELSTWGPFGVVFWIVVGAIVGFFLPSGAAAHLTALEADLEGDFSEGSIVKEISARKEKRGAEIAAAVPVGNQIRT
jgi:hypothetical protein